MSGLDLDAIERTHESWAKGAAACPQPEGPCIRCQMRATDAAGDVPALVAEVRRLRAALAWHTDGPGPDVTTVYDRDGDPWMRDGDRWRCEGDGGAVTWAALVIKWGPITVDRPEVVTAVQTRAPACSHGYDVHRGMHPNGKPCDADPPEVAR